MGLGVGVGDPARDLLRVHCARAHEREHRRWIVTRLLGQDRKVDRPAVGRGGVPVLSLPAGSFQFAQLGPQTLGRRVPGAACFIVVEADVDESRQERSGREDYGVRVEGQADLGHDPDHLVPRKQQVVHRLLEER